MLFAAGVLAIEALESYAMTFPEDEIAPLVGRLEELQDRIALADRLHEAYLSGEPDA